MHPPTISRRTLLGGGLVLGAGLLPSFLRHDAGPVSTDPLAERFASLIDGDHVRDLGRAHATSLPASWDAATLARQVVPAPYDPTTALEAPLGDLRDAFTSRIDDEYRHGRVVSVAGWLLSVTEARLCALSIAP